jgi:hypothetical protein
MPKEFRYEIDPQSPWTIRRVFANGEESEFAGRMVSAELAQETCDALNGGHDPLAVLAEAADVLDGLHERLHRLKHEGVHEETVRQAGRVISNHASGNIAGPVVQTGYVGRVSTHDVTGLDRAVRDRIDLLGT